MNKSVHVLIGKHLYASIKERFQIYLDRESFLLGNVLPDLCLNFMIRPHVLMHYDASIQSRIQNLLNIRQATAVFDKNYSRQLGVICHYYADYFCYPHRQDYTGDVLSHMKYEREMQRYLKDKIILQPDRMLFSEWQTEADERMLFNSLSRLQESYMNLEPSFENDIAYSIRACTEALLLMTRTAMTVQTEEYELCYPA